MKLRPGIACSRCSACNGWRCYVDSVRDLEAANDTCSCSCYSFEAVYPTSPDRTDWGIYGDTLQEQWLGVWFEAETLSGAWWDGTVDVPFWIRKESP